MDGEMDEWTGGQTDEGAESQMWGHRKRAMKTGCTDPSGLDVAGTQ